MWPSAIMYEMNQCLWQLLVQWPEVTFLGQANETVAQDSDCEAAI